MNDHPAPRRPGTSAPHFSLPRTHYESVSLRDVHGHPAVLVFYPGDWEPVSCQQLALYQQQRYAEASFQFRKALALDPGHEEAQRYLGYTQGAGADTAISGRFGRLE